MPHVIVKLWPGKSDEQKARLSEAITRNIMAILNYGEDPVSVAMEEIAPGEWTDKVYKRTSATSGTPSPRSQAMTR